MLVSSGEGHESEFPVVKDICILMFSFYIVSARIEQLFMDLDQLSCKFWLHDFIVVQDRLDLT